MLRKYQIEIKNKVQNTEFRKNVLQMPTGSGKTYTFIEIAKDHFAETTERVLILVHRTELLEQARKSLGEKCFLINAGVKNIPHDYDYYIGMVETTHKRIEKLPKFGMVIIDECFIAGTKVDEKNIEDLNIGDYVKSYNHSKNIIENKKVLNTSKKLITNDLLLISFGSVQFACTHKHPIFVKNKGYVNAEDLKINDIVYGVYNLLEQRLPKENIKGELRNKDMEVEIIENKKRFKNFLLKTMSSKYFRIRKFYKNEREQSNVEGGKYNKNVRNIKEDRTQTKNSRWEWSWNDRSTKNAFVKFGRELVCGISNYNRKWLSTISLQNRYWKSIQENSNRNRWWFSFKQKVKIKGCKEGRIITEQRVQSIEIYKQSNINKYESCEEQNYVYNIEVEDNNNYFANGILVHNCHIGNFKKLPYFEEYSNEKILGVTATPISEKPLKFQYDNLILGPTVEHLINENHLLNCDVYGFASDLVSKENWKIKKGEFDEKQMEDFYSSEKMVKNVVNAYWEKSAGKKTLIFNVNLKHNECVRSAFALEGLEVRTISSETEKGERKEIITWFKNNKHAILCNVGVLTTGFDEPSVETIILNRATKSLALYLQMIGRGSRPFEGKEKFLILDLGKNTIRHGPYTNYFDWQAYFEHGAKLNDGKKTNGIAPVKECPECHFLQHTRKLVCHSCGHDFEEEAQRQQKEEKEQKLVLLISTKPIDLPTERIFELAKERNWKEWAVLHKIAEHLTNYYNKHKATEGLKETIVSEMLKETANWCKVYDKKFNKWIQDVSLDILDKKINPVTHE